MTETFSITRVNRLRRAAERARALPFEETDFRPHGYLPEWQQRIAGNYANDLLRVFDTLWLKPGLNYVPPCSDQVETETARSGRCRPIPNTSIPAKVPGLKTIAWNARLRSSRSCRQ